MANPPADLGALTVRRPGAAPAPSAIHPPRRWFSRLALPLLLLAGFGALALWAFWDVILAPTPVTATPVVARTSVVEAQGVELFTATGWIEPRFSTVREVNAFRPGIIKELLVRPGQRVDKGSVLFRLEDIVEAQALEAASLELAARKLKVPLAQAMVEETQGSLRAAEAKLANHRKLLDDKLIGIDTFNQASAEMDIARAKLKQADVAAAEAENLVKQATLAETAARTRLEQMTIASPVAGIVLKVHAEAGSAIGMTGMPSTVVTLYDPDSLQVRVEVRLDKFPLVREDLPATIEVDSYPDTKLFGRVLYDTHETDITLNTVRIKVGLLQLPMAYFEPKHQAGDRVGSLAAAALDPWAAVGMEILAGGCLAQQQVLAPQAKLRPKMFARVRLLAPPTAKKDAGGETLRLFIPRRLLVGEGGQTRVWLIEPDVSGKPDLGRAVLRTITLAQASRGDFVEVTQGLQPSDKLISSGTEGLQQGARVRITRVVEEGAKE
jgi:multidrug efflux pump subunit AcrA (membrane-fusion protein)